jgi:hypothetical protein
MEIYKQNLNVDIFMVIAAPLLSPLDEIIYLIFQITYCAAVITSYFGRGFGVLYCLWEAREGKGTENYDCQLKHNLLALAPCANTSISICFNS